MVLKKYGNLSLGGKFNFTLFLIYFFFIILLFITGFFSIGLLSDDYLNFYDAVSSSFTAKFTGNLPFTSHLHFRPLYYLNLQVSAYVHSLLGFSYDDFVFYRVQNLVMFLVLVFIAGRIILLRTKSMILSLIASSIILLFPNNLHNLCWTAARVDLICGIFYLLTILLTFLYLENAQSGSSRLHWFIGSLLTLTLALMTKETAITAPAAVLLFAVFIYRKTLLKRHKSVFILQFAILAVYISYRTAFLGNNATEAAAVYQPNPSVNIPGVLARAVISFLIPVDYLSLNIGLRNRETVLLLYLLILYSAIIYFVILTIRSNAYKSLLQIIVFGFVVLAPYFYIGYLRPQMILIPFVLLLIQLLLLYFANSKLHQNLKKNLALMLLAGCALIFIKWDITVVHDWKFAYEDSKKRMNVMLGMNLDSNKTNVIIGNPARLKQSFTFNKLTGAYNYWNLKQFSVVRKFNDIVQTAALDTVSLKSKLSFVTAGPGEFEIRVTGPSQFFSMEGFDNIRMKSGFQNKALSVEFMDYNIIDKPTKMKLKILSSDHDFYLVSGMDFVKLN